MADKMMLFTIDASEMIAKLHLAGLQPIKGDLASYNGFIVNTGIVDDSPQNSPEKIGNTRFDLNNKSGTYYVGLVRDFTYKTWFTFENAATDLYKLRSEMNARGKKLLDPNDAEDE